MIFFQNFILIWKCQKWSLNRGTLVSATAIYQTKCPFIVLSALFLFFRTLPYDSRLFPECIVFRQVTDISKRVVSQLTYFRKHNVPFVIWMKTFHAFSHYALRIPWSDENWVGPYGCICIIYMKSLSHVASKRGNNGCVKRNWPDQWKVLQSWFWFKLSNKGLTQVIFLEWNWWVVWIDKDQNHKVLTL